MSRKIKHSLEFKIAIVKKVLKRDRSIANISKENQVGQSMLKRWVQFYQRFGEAGLCPQSNFYSLDTKLAVLKSLKDNNLSLSRACLQFNIRSTGVLSHWIRIYEKEGIEGLMIEKRGKSKLMPSKETNKKLLKPLTDHERILEENKLLRAENAFLKKLQALIQKEEAEKKRKR